MKHFLFYTELSVMLSRMYICFHVKHLFLLSDFTDNFNFLDRLSKNTQIIFHEKPFTDSRVVSCGPDRQTDTTKLLVAFRNFSNASKNGSTRAQEFVREKDINRLTV